MKCEVSKSEVLVVYSKLQPDLGLSELYRCEGFFSPVEFLAARLDRETVHNSIVERVLNEPEALVAENKRHWDAHVRANGVPDGMDEDTVKTFDDLAFCVGVCMVAHNALGVTSVEFAEGLKKAVGRKGLNERFWLIISAMVDVEALANSLLDDAA